MTPQIAAACYIAYCKSRDLSPNSVTSYRHALGYLVRSLPDTQMEDMQPQQIADAWRRVAEAPTLSANSVRSYRVILATWLDWCTQKAGLKAHNLRAMPLPKRTAPHRPKVTVQRLYALRSACDKLPIEYERSRAHALLEVMWSTLTRRAEVMQLRLCHLRLEDDPPMVRIECGKGGWSGALPISDLAAATLRKWVITRGDAGHDWLWCNQGPKRLPMGPRALYKLLAKLAADAGIAVDECKPHAVRRGSSTAMLQAGHDISTVSLYLRHRSIQTTMAYVESNTSRLLQVRNWMDEREKATAQADATAQTAAADANTKARHEQDRQIILDRSRRHVPTRHRMQPPTG
jgi:site-specific recombinase XerD